MMNVNVAPDWATAAPTLPVIVDNPGPNWERVKADFEAGNLSIREIAAREGISDTAIRKRAKAEDWFAPGSRTGSQSGSHPPANQVRTKEETEAVIAKVESILKAREPDCFDWTANNPEIVIHNPPSLAVYLNGDDHIVIRQDFRGEDDEDMFVFLAKRDVPRLIERLRKLAAA